MADSISNSADIIDSRDVIERIEELEGFRMRKLYQLKDATTNRLAFRSVAALLVVFVLTLAAGAQEKPSTPHAFFDRTNLALFSADALVRTLDAESTRAMLARGNVEDSIPAIASRSSTMYAYSVGVAGAIMGASYVMHRTGHHRIERILPMIDIVYDGRDAVGNYRLGAPLKSATFGEKVRTR